ncbi:uncharacterized protein LOC129588099 [Paramacrobiotus metropolitanus]|uniref:uncharacterized protein LOC129588099 n=1 Tax=Paramacrobiotus metropolitanus TaxID=2943436 RepID=UPI002445B66D|nr:uncharacterized protein LOC129588099 [Paramacrobiotus metropolitanus]
MTDSSVSRDSLAPSWLRSSAHSPTQLFRPSLGSRHSVDDSWDRAAADRKSDNRFRTQWIHGDAQHCSHSDQFFTHGNNHNRISDFDEEVLIRRSHSNTLKASNGFGSRHGNNHHHLRNGRSKYDEHFRHGSAFTNGLSVREANTGSNGISYSFVATKNLQATHRPNSPHLQQSDFPSLTPMKAEPATAAQNTVWGKPPQLTKVVKRSLSSQSYLGTGGTVLGPSCEKAFLGAVLGSDLKEDFTLESNGNCENGLTECDYLKVNYPEPPSSLDGDNDAKLSFTDAHNDIEIHSESDEICTWSINGESRDSPLIDHCSPSGMLSSSGSTGSVESIDSHQSHLSGTTAMMVEDLLDETIAEEEKLQIMHALEELKERTGFESYYERIAVNDTSHRERCNSHVVTDGKTEDDDEDPDDRFLK